MRAIRILTLAVVTILAVGCSRTFRGTTTQPNPLARPTETLRHSEKITIVTGDMELETPEQPEGGQRVALVKNNRYPLYNQASFTIVSRDRLRFHVQVDHKWQEWADLKTWSVELTDDAGRRWRPESVEHPTTKMMTTMWDREQRTPVRNRYGDVVGVHEDGFRNRQTLGSLSVYRGRADFVFHEKDLFHANVKKLRLVVKRPGESFVFTWNFQDTVASE